VNSIKYAVFCYEGGGMGSDFRIFAVSGGQEGWTFQKRLCWGQKERSYRGDVCPEARV
jgi:hypothetical protein